VKRLECEFEAEVLAAALHGCWPEVAGEALRSHVSGCAICADVAAIADPINQSRQELRMSAALPNPGIVWWRAQLRARREAAVAAGRPITGVQVLAAACALAVLVGYFQNATTWFRATSGKWITALMTDHLILAIAALVLILLLPAAVLLTVGRD